MNELDSMKGTLDTGTCYSTNKHKCVEFVSAIADVQRKEICDNLSKCNFLSVLVDGSMDSAITDNKMVYVQYCQAGIIKTNFIYCCQVQ